MFLEKAYIGKNNWYFYVLTLMIVFVAIQIGSIPLVAYLYLNGSMEQDFASMLNQMTNTNTGLALTLFTYLVGFFTLFLCVRYIQHKPYASIVTGRSRIDYRRILFGAVIWGIIMIGSVAFDMLVSKENTIVFQFDPVNFFTLVIIALIFLPFQTALEELVFRGLLMQGFALLFKYRWVAILLTSLLFALMHGSNPEIEKFGFWTAIPIYFVIALILGYVAVKDDGLELALGLHMANNIVSALTLTHEGSALQTHALFCDTAPTASIWDSVSMLVCGGIFILICNAKYRFLGKINIWGKITDKQAVAE